MSAEILQFARVNNVASFIRLGYNNHRILEDLHAGNQLMAQRVVVEAQNTGKQADLIQMLNATGTDLVLDTRCAEMACDGSFQSAISKLPWGARDEPHKVNTFTDLVIRRVAKQIAEFAIDNRFSSVISPSHVIQSASDPWLPIDIQMCQALREELDAVGGKEIGVDYMLISKNLTLLSDEANRRAIIGLLKNLPFINLWLKVSGFGADSTAAALRRYINCAWNFSLLGKPIIADHVGGLVGLSLLAFNAVGGISHGVGLKERFSLRGWTHRSTYRGGPPKRYYFPNLDIHLPIQKALDLVSHKKGAAGVLRCNDVNCCTRGRNNSISNHHEAHFLVQRHRQLVEVSKFTGERRTEYFLENIFGGTLANSRKIEKLKNVDESVMAKIVKNNIRLERMDSVLRDLHSTSKIQHTALVPNRCKVNYL